MVVYYNLLPTGGPTTNTSPPFFPTSPSPCLQSSSAPPPRRHETLVPRPVPLSTSPPRDREREMYSDQISTGRKRSIHERLDGDLPGGAGAGGRTRHMASKRSVQGAAPLLNPCSALVTATAPHLPDRVGSGRHQIGNLPYPGLLRVLENYRD